MKKYARVDDDTVVELIETDGDISEMFHPDTVWVDVTSVPGVENGWRKNGSIFDPPPSVSVSVSVVKATVWDDIKAKRDAVVLSGTKVGAKWYHSDEASRTKYIGLLRLADAAVAAGGSGTTALQYGGQDIQWKTMDGSFIKMTVQRANDVFNAVTGLYFAAFGVAEVHRTEMEASADPANYDFSANWPAVYVG